MHSLCFQRTVGLTLQFWAAALVLRWAEEILREDTERNVNVKGLLIITLKQVTATTHFTRRSRSWRKWDEVICGGVDTSSIFFCRGVSCQLASCELLCCPLLVHVIIVLNQACPLRRSRLTWHLPPTAKMFRAHPPPPPYVVVTQAPCVLESKRANTWPALKSSCLPTSVDKQHHHH